MRRALRVWGPVAAWAAAILVLTTAPVPTPEGAEGVPHLDKLVHFLLYLGLGGSLGRALWSSRRASIGAAWLAVSAGAGFGAANEWIQGLTSHRDPSTADWLADVAGVSVGVALHLWRRRAG